ncbi:MAG TPA: carbohydrate-binding protein [Terriglobales bacterium]|nr:carbohydrate-binding protein [Terriglobales bacterium]
MRIKAAFPFTTLVAAMLFLAAQAAHAAEGPYGGTPAPIPGTVQAENYDTGGQGVAYNVTAVNGTGNSYRSDGVDLEACTDSSGCGYDIGWTASGQWFKYTVNVATAGTYTVTFRLAAIGAVTDGLHISNSSGTNISGNINVPATGGWQTWTNVTVSMSLPAGTQTLTINQDNAGWNVNYVTFAGTGGPYGGTPWPLPGTVQAENYDLGGSGVGYHVNSVNGTGNGYRTDGVDLEATTDTGGGYDIGWTAGGQWFKYTVNVASAGTYTVTLRLAGPSAVSDALHISNSSGTNLSGNVGAPATGGYQTWANVTATVTLPAGVQTLTVNQDNAGWNINYFSVAGSGGEGPYGGSPAPVPGTVQAENYDTGGQGVAYQVSSVNGSGNSYRSDGVDLEATTDSGGGYDVGWTASGQWFKYTVNVSTAGSYTVGFRVAAPTAVTDGFHLANSSGSNLSGNINVPATGGWQTWSTVTATVTLPAGQQTLTLYQDNGGWNINWMSFSQGGGGTGSCTGVSNIVVNGVTYVPQWCQEFNGAAGSPDTSVWNFDLGNNGGWGNGEQEVYCGPPGYANNPSQCPTTFSTSTAPVYIDGSGHLVIQPRNVGGTWISGRMNTQNKQNFGYGILVANIQAPNTTNQGLWPAWWTLGSNISSVPWPTCGEADIMELWSPQVYNGPGPNGNNSTIHTAKTGGNGVGARYTFPSGQANDTAFHQYGIVWQANQMQFYVDNPGSPFFTVTPSSLPSGDTWPFNQNIFAILNVAVGGTLGGSTSGLSNPGPLVVDYVRWYTPQ